MVSSNKLSQTIWTVLSQVIVVTLACILLVDHIDFNTSFEKVVIAILLFIFIPPIILYVSRKNFTRRLSRLSNNIEQLSNLDLLGRIEIEGDDEIGSMADNLNLLTSKYAKTIKRCNQLSSTIGDYFNKFSDGVETVGNQVSQQSTVQEEAIKELQEVVQQLRAGFEKMDQLSRNTGESSSTILSIATANEEVTDNLANLATSVEQTVTSIEEMNYSTKEISRNIDDLASVAEETSSSMYQMDISINQVETNALETSRLSEQVSKDAEKGVDSITKTIQGIEKIKDSTRFVYEVIENLSKKILAIGNILNVIDDVTEQTNLLALNASIIAAQAGEHGKGFAVVADEIKELAERTGASTKEISDLIKSVQEQSQNAMRAVEMGSQNVEDGVALSYEAESALKKILSSAQKSTDMIQTIARSTEEQSLGSKQVTNAISRIATTAQQVALSSSEQARGTELMMKSAGQMQLITQQVKRSTQDQTQSSSTMSKALGNITDMTQDLNSNQKEQNRKAERVLLTMENFKSQVDQQTHTIRNLTPVIVELKGQIEDVSREISQLGNV